MNKELLQFQLILLFSSVITLFYLYDRELNKKKISLLFSICNISIFLIEIRMIGNLRYLTIAAALFLVFRYYSKQPNKAYIPQINILNTQVQECTNKIDQEMEQQPQYLPAIPSIHESNSSMTPKQIRLSNENINGPQNTTERGQQHIKQDSGMSFLGDNKRSQYSKNYSNGGMPQRQLSSSPNQSNFNVIKFQDDCGEIKFGILKTLKSVNYDQLGKEMEGIYQNDKTLTKLLTNIEKKGGPRTQILYESQQQTHQVFDDNLRGGIQLDYTNNDSIKIDEPKKVTWKKIWQTLFFQTVLICNLYISHPWQSVQVILFAFICLRQILILSKLKIKELEITLDFRQILIWNSLVFLPLIFLFILNLIVQSIALIVTTIAQLISVMITLKYYRACYEHIHLVSFYILLLATLLCFI
ncbi:unnamed protein product (macronuclear) [Paramecium tetraurelia]|uniref:Transmembrane protein n=1 Tax=Paramecium tetraurelia TaxID=5888 RepID=A0E9P0_PARTE|nr:uncharacterized protein GSPATT00024738001 [Paramecium tetraurelia]CAK92007.1 unnamed protein product [Paramecium tetraurelia]|eukprot:XP_001459404.1 hypothetical protein (macronuclear) [Paramecium tetraurelia strain d4-2]